MTTHDYTQSQWGHAIYVISIGDNTARVIGFGVGVRQGDYLLLENDTGSTRYRVEAIERKRPADCWGADLTFAPREEGE